MMLKGSLLIALTALSLFGQTAPTPGVASAANAYQAQFNAAYYNSKAQAFQPLYQGRPGSSLPASFYPLSTVDQWNLCGTLISQGFIVDEQIDCQSWDPLTTMMMRQMYGDTWEPAGAGAVQVTSVAQPGAVVAQSARTGPVPAGAIPVCVLISCYPPFPVPASPTAVVQPLAPVPNPIGAVEFFSGSAPAYIGSEFKCIVGSNNQDGYAFGATWTGTSQGLTGTWQKVSVMLGMASAWQKIQ